MGFYRAQRQCQGLGRFRVGEFVPRHKQHGRALFRRQAPARPLYPAAGRDRTGNGLASTAAGLRAASAAASHACFRDICARRCRTARAGMSAPGRTADMFPGEDECLLRQIVGIGLIAGSRRKKARSACWCARTSREKSATDRPGALRPCPFVFRLAQGWLLSSGRTIPPQGNRRQDRPDRHQRQRHARDDVMVMFREPCERQQHRQNATAAAARTEPARVQPRARSLRRAALFLRLLQDFEQLGRRLPCPDRHRS